MMIWYTSFHMKHSVKKPLLRDVFDYLLRPIPRSTFLNDKDIKSCQSDRIERIIAFLKTALTKFVHVIRIYAILIVIAISIALLSSIFVAGKTTNELDNYISKESILFVLIYGGIFAPLFEEIVFRVHLKMSPVRWAIFVVAQCAFLLISFSEKFVWIVDFFSFTDNLYINIGINLLLSIALVAILFIIFKRIKIDIGEKLYAVIFYASAIYFGFIHTANYSNIAEVWYLALLLVLPQIIAGIFLGYVRIRYGLIWSIVLHSIYNGSLIFPVFLMASFMSNFDIASSNIPTSSQDIAVLLFVGIYAIFLFLVIFGALIYNIVELLLHKNEAV